MKHFFTLLLALTFYPLFSQNPDIKYTREWGQYFRISEGTAVDPAGNLWMVLSVDQNYSAIFLTPDAHQSAYGGGDSDLFLVKFSPAGDLLYGSYYGGEGNEDFVAVDVNNYGEVYIAGRTSSSQNIATPGSYQENLLQNTDPNGNLYNPSAGYLAKFGTGGQLEWGTYFQGNRTALLYEVAAGNDEVYVTGATTSDNLGTPGAFKENIPAPFLNDEGLYEAPFYPLIAKFSDIGNLEWATYYAPDMNNLTDYSSPQFNPFGGLSLDVYGDIYMAGSSRDTEDYYGTPNAHQTQNAGNGDVFLSKFSASGQRLWSTYYGGSGLENSLYIHIGRDNNFYLSGRTTSFNNIATSGSYEPVLTTASATFLVKFNPLGQRQWGTYFNTGGYSVSNPCFVNPDGFVFLGGLAENPALATPGSWQENYAGENDMYIAKFDPSGSNLLWASYYGGDNNDYCFGEGLLATADNGFYISGITASTNNIASPGMSGAAGYGGFVAKFVPCPEPVMPVAESPQDFQPSETISDLEVETVEWTGSEPILTWYADAAGTQILSPDTALEAGTTYYVTQSIQGCDESELLVITTQTLGISETEFSSISLFPNPNNGNFTLENLPKLPLKINVVDILGKQVHVFSESIFPENFQISLNQLGTGIYFLEINAPNAKKVLKFVVE